jgi:hypothetical protein
MSHDELPRPHDAPSAFLEVDALLDGECVDKEALRVALGEAAARDYLIDALLLRQLTHVLGPRTYVAPAVAPSPLSRGLRWLAATLVVAAGVGGGYLYGQLSAEPRQSSSVEVAVDTSPVAPTPTRTIRFEPGVNWTPHTGSH